MGQMVGRVVLVLLMGYLAVVLFPLALLVALLLREVPQMPWWYSAEGGPRR